VNGDASAIPTDYGLAPILEHADRLGLLPGPWLQAGTSYIERLRAEALDLWSPVEFVLPHLLETAGNDSTAFARLTALAGDLILQLHESGVPRTRTEQYGIRAAASAVRDVDALVISLEVAIALAAGGHDPGWILQMTVPVLWDADADHDRFARRLEAILRTAFEMADLDVSPGYPFAVGLAGIVRHGEALSRHLEEWLTTIISMTGSLVRSSINPYPVLEYGLPGLGPDAGFPSGYVTEALEVARRLADRGVYPGNILQEGLAIPRACSTDSTGSALVIDEILTVARRLAESAIDPCFVLCRGFVQARTLLPDDGHGPAFLRFAALAEELHRNSHSLQPVFEEGLYALSGMEQDRPGIFRRGFALAEAIARTGHNPVRALTQGLPRALDALRSLPNGEEECFEWAYQLVDAGIEPSAALATALPEIVAVAGTDTEALRQLGETLFTLLESLAGLGLDYRSVLVHDRPDSVAEDSDTSGSFIRILELMDALVRRSAEVSADAAGRLIESLPAVARVADGSLWVLEESLQLCTRILAVKGNPVPFLAETVGPLLRVSRNNSQRFRDLGAAIADRSPMVPDDAWRAVAAVISASGDSVDDIERSIDHLLHALSVLRRDEGDGAVRVTCLAIVEAAPLATGTDEFGALLTAVVREVHRFRDHADRFDFWVDHGLPVQVTLAEGHLDRGVTAMHQIGEWCRRRDAPADRVLRSCAPGATQVAHGDLDVFLSVLESCDDLLSCLPDAGMTTRLTLSSIMNVVTAAEAEAHGQWRTAIGLARESVTGADPEYLQEFLDLFRNIERVLIRWPGAWNALLAPLVKAHGRHSRAYLDQIVRGTPNLVTGTDDLTVLREATVDRGVAAMDILYSVLVPLVRRGIVTGLAAERETILAFLREVPFRNPDLYIPYRDAMADPGTTREERRRIVGKLQDEYREILTAIRSGDVDEMTERSQLFFSAMTYLFPPSMSVPGNSYRGLYGAVPDRPEDVSRRIPDEADRRRGYALTRGGYHLRPGASAAEEVWEPLLAALSDDKESAHEPVARLGWDLLVLWGEGRIGRPGTKQRTWRRLAGPLRRFGEAIPRDTTSATDLLAVRRLFEDRMRDAVEEALVAARAEDPERYRRIVQDKLSPFCRVGPGLTSAVRAQLAAYRDGDLSGDVAIERLSRLLGSFAVDVRTILDAPAEGATDSGLREILESAGPRPIDPTAGNEVTRIHRELTGKEVQAMNRDLYGHGLHPGILVYRPASREVVVTFEVTKRRAHSVVGFVEGVCVAEDVDLWNDPDFLQVIIWDADGFCRGGVHLLFHQTTCGCMVMLPGINPANALLQQIDAEQFLDVAIDFARRIARVAGCHGVWIPADLAIASNRQPIREAIEGRKWPRLPIPAIRFAHSPFSYLIDDVYEVPCQS
jgi:hypothetical protein